MKRNRNVMRLHSNVGDVYQLTPTNPRDATSRLAYHCAVYRTGQKSRPNSNFRIIGNIFVLPIEHFAKCKQSTGGRDFGGRCCP